jgi:hypothetical protein
LYFSPLLLLALSQYKWWWWLTSVDDDRVDPHWCHRISVSGNDEHFVAFDGELRRTDGTQTANDTEPVPHARLHVYLRVWRGGWLSPDLQQAVPSRTLRVGWREWKENKKLHFQYHRNVESCGQ